MSSPLLRGKQVMVVGLGKSGLSAARLLLREGARVVVEEDRTLQQLGAIPDALRHPAVTLRLGQPRTRASWEACDLIVISPGVPLSLPFLQEAAAAGKELMGEVELAFRFLPEASKLVGVTGTNGKSTTTALAGELFRQGGQAPFVGGNLGTPLSEAVLDGVEHGAYVVELSSFQLEGTSTLHLCAAAILNLTPDHLDRYPSHAAYGQAKARIFRNQGPGDVAVVNADDAPVRALSTGGSTPVYGFTLRQEPQVELGLAGLAVVTPTGFRLTFHGGPAFTLTNPALRGPHNSQNAMAATLLALHGGVSPQDIQRGLDAYPGLPHRLESVRQVAGVEWVNDSKATNVDSTVVALRAFPEGTSLWLIAGGKGKGAPYAPLASAGHGRVVGILTLGADAETLARELGGTFPIHPCGTLEGAVDQARRLAKPGDVVLLSPACASYDQFQNFEHRGETFKRLVMALPS